MDVIHIGEQKSAAIPATPCVLALGFFDGVHRGHQQVIAAARARAKALHLPLAVLTFDQHASQVFHTKHSQAFRYLTTVNQKAALMARLGVNRLYVLHFDEAVANLAPQTFVERWLVGLKAQAVVAGFDYTYGAGGKATTADLEATAAGRFGVVTVQPVTVGAWKISSTRVRQLIDVGDIGTAETLLGHPFTMAVHAKGVVLTPELTKQQLPPPGRYHTMVGREPVTVTLDDEANLTADRPLSGPLVLADWTAVVSRRSVSLG